MNSRDWEKIQKNYVGLRSQLNYKELIDYLVSKSVLSDDDTHVITESPIPKNCMKKLLETLKSKSSDKNAFKLLLEGLRNTGNEWLADDIERTPADGDSEVRAKCDPEGAEDKVRELLLSNFVTKKDSETALSGIERVLQEKKVFQGMDEWIPEKISNFVCSVFSGVKPEKRKIRKKMTFTYDVYLKNLHIKEEARTSAESCQATQSALTGATLYAHIERMSCQELRNYLAPHFQAQRLDEKLLDKLEANEIDGCVFLKLKEETLKEALPTATLGARCKVNMIIESLRGEAPSPHTESCVRLREFDSPVGYTDKYHLGRCCDVTTCVKGKTTQPLRIFNLIEASESKKKTLEFIGSAVVMFASACMNERRDGTIYFGVSPDQGPIYKRGEIVGIDVPREEIEEAIRHYLEKSFDSTYKDLVKTTTRDAKFVPVIDAPKSPRSLMVVEVDVRPSSAMLKEGKIMTLHKLSGFPETSKSSMYRFSSDGLPEPLSAEEMFKFEKVHPGIVRQRERDEEEKKKDSVVNLRMKLLNLLTGGCEVMQDLVYPFFMLSPRAGHMNKKYLLENMQFVQYMRPELVMDFDPKGYSDGVYGNLDQEQKDSMILHVIGSSHKISKENLAVSHWTTWMFCNGYIDIQPVSQYDWKKSNKEDFMNTIQIFIEYFGIERIILIVCLFSDNYDTMMDACDEIVSKLGSSWIVLAETEDIARKWSESMLFRCAVEHKDLTERCILGMSWLEVNATLLQAAGKATPHALFLPTSKGARIKVEENKSKEWCDLELLTAGDLQVDKDRNVKKELQQQFYIGEQAQWLNFWFEDHILRRDVHGPLIQKVEEALKGQHKEEESMVSVVRILHQSMAGGTTSARQVLWDLRTKYRCCIMKTFSEETQCQLEEVHSYEDTSPLPLLILIDNENEENIMKLRTQLEERGRHLWQHDNLPFNVYCTILLCLRMTSLPKEIDEDCTALRQELSTKELMWFDHKYEELTQNYERCGNSDFSPKLLLSFNILKENFNKDYIKRVVDDFAKDVIEAKEIELLKFVSFLNTYDPNFKPIRVSALDKFIANVGSACEAVLSHTSQRKLHWEARLSQPVKVLLNLSTNREIHRKSRTHIRACNKLIAEEILSNMKERCDIKDSTIMQQILQSGVFKYSQRDMEDMKITINNIAKKREMESNNKETIRFSKFVLCVKEAEGPIVAVKILEDLFEKNQDAFTAQLISRFYITLSNWTKAEQFADRAIDLLPSNSFLWDTYGRVLKSQLQEKIETKGSHEEIIKISKKCIDAFKKAQKFAEVEMTRNGDINVAGYFGELSATVLLLNAIKTLPCFADPTDFHNFLVAGTTNTSISTYLSETEQIEYLKNTFSSTSKAWRRLDEEVLQMEDNSSRDMTVSVKKNYLPDLLRLKVDLDQYFGAPGLQVPTNIPEDRKCIYRSALIRKCGGSSLNQLLVLRSKGMEDEIQKVYHLVSDNVKISPVSFDDARTFLDVVTVLLVDGKAPKDVTYRNIVEWSKHLYDQRQTDGFPYLEPYLYFTMYNFPTEERRNEDLCFIFDLKKATTEMFKTFQQKYPKKVPARRKEKNLFFLGNGPPLKDIVHQDQLHKKMEGHPNHSKWQLPEVRKMLRRMKGQLARGGEEIVFTVTDASGNKFRMNIVTSDPVRKKNMWLKQIYFYLGFSFSGPKAFGVSLESGSTET